MRPRMLVPILFVLTVGLVSANGTAQILLNENHYKVYEVPEVYTVTGEFRLVDQFGFLNLTFLELDKFALPVEKNGEIPPFPDLHQTWWRIDEQQPVKLVDIFNQFGHQDSLIVKDARYLVVPATKNTGTLPPAHNHYKCYDVLNMPSLDLPVVLTDQFGSMTAMVKEPVLFCNPVQKEVNGVVFPIEDPFPHLTCYRLDPPMLYGIPVVATDQFGDWQLTAEEHLWLCVPTEKLVWIANEERTWGNIKSLYRE